MNEAQTSPNLADKQSNTSNEISIDSSKFANVVLKRLIEEVRFEAHNNVTAYNRTHNRHNRGR